MIYYKLIFLLIFNMRFYAQYIVNPTKRKKTKKTKKKKKRRKKESTIVKL